MLHRLQNSLLDLERFQLSYLCYRFLKGESICPTCDRTVHGKACPWESRSTARQVCDQ